MSLLPFQKNLLQTTTLRDLIDIFSEEHLDAALSPATLDIVLEKVEDLVLPALARYNDAASFSFLRWSKEGNETSPILDSIEDTFTAIEKIVSFVTEIVANDDDANEEAKFNVLMSNGEKLVDVLIFGLLRQVLAFNTCFLRSEERTNKAAAVTIEEIVQNSVLVIWDALLQTGIVRRKQKAAEEDEEFLKRPKKFDRPRRDDLDDEDDDDNEDDDDYDDLQTEIPQKGEDDGRLCFTNFPMSQFFGSFGLADALFENLAHTSIEINDYCTEFAACVIGNVASFEGCTKFFENKKSCVTHFLDAAEGVRTSDQTKIQMSFALTNLTVSDVNAIGFAKDPRTVEILLDWMSPPQTDGAIERQLSRIGKRRIQQQRKNKNSQKTCISSSNSEFYSPNKIESSSFVPVIQPSPKGIQQAAKATSNVAFGSLGQSQLYTPDAVATIVGAFEFATTSESISELGSAINNITWGKEEAMKAFADFAGTADVLFSSLATNAHDNEALTWLLSSIANTCMTDDGLQVFLTLGKPDDGDQKDAGNNKNKAGAGLAKFMPIFYSCLATVMSTKNIQNQIVLECVLSLLVVGQEKKTNKGWTFESDKAMNVDYQPFGAITTLEDAAEVVNWFKVKLVTFPDLIDFYGNPFFVKNLRIGVGEKIINKAENNQNNKLIKESWQNVMDKLATSKRMK